MENRQCDARGGQSSNPHLVGSAASLAASVADLMASRIASETVAVATVAEGLPTKYPIASAGHTSNSINVQTHSPVSVGGLVGHMAEVA
nr:hypothetical protein B0A51_09232 [Rachicladosporium sp. CCFEE 5018]